MARQLLAQNGVIFVSIDDHEIENVRLVMNEVFGEDNFVATLVWKMEGQEVSAYGERLKKEFDMADWLRLHLVLR